MPGQLAQLPIDWEHFLAHFWQQKPLLIPEALPAWAQPHAALPVDADTLAGLALEEDVESRLIERADTAWQLLHGPFIPQDFDRTDPWTLLVQAVDHYLPEVAELKSLFHALPSWRMDDVMVSYASDGGSVGPHYDNYDVFLLQGEGQRRWQLGQHCGPDSALIEHDELRILKAFDCVDEYLLGPGDMLYVPPGVAHWGVAVGECTTFSVGFRAPGMQALLSRRIDAQLESMPREQFYTDRGALMAQRAGEIRQEDIDRVNAQLSASLADFSSTGWFGELVTEPRYDAEPETESLAAAHQRLAQGAESVAISPSGRVAWQMLSSGQLCVFANGHSRAFDNAVLASLEVLCAGQALTAVSASAQMKGAETTVLLGWLLDCGCLDVE